MIFLTVQSAIGQITVSVLLDRLFDRIRLSRTMSKAQYIIVKILYKNIG